MESMETGLFAPDEFYNLDESYSPEYIIYDEDIVNVPMTESESAYHDQLTKFDLLGYMNEFNLDPRIQNMNEASYQQRIKNETFKLEVLDIDRFIKDNDLKEVTNPIFFAYNGLPTSDGLLSNDIFGITQSDRSGTFAYITLGDYFIDPSCYKCLCKIESKIPFIVKGIKRYSIDKDGQLVDDPEGETGIRWLKKNFDKLSFMRSASRSRDLKIDYIAHNYKTGRLFINKWIIIPPYYRDVNTASKKRTGVGQINTLYVNLLTAANSLKDNNDYGFSLADTTCARIQETLKTIYDWFCGNTNTAIKDKGTGMSGKFGLIKQNMSYTADYSSRLVISAPELKVETVDDLMVDLDKSAVPLAACAADFYPFVIYHMRKFFENELLNVTTYECINSKGDRVSVPIMNPMISFSDDVLKDQLKKFVYSFSNRFLPVILPADTNDNETYYMWFKGERYISPEEVNAKGNPFVDRPLTWVDVIYIACCYATEGKTMSFTRFPYDSYFNTIYTKIEVSSTKETEPMYVDGILYRHYPKIRAADIYANTGNKFIDTMQISNLYLKGMGGDYDGDMGQIKGSFFKETNDELAKFTNSKANYIDLSGSNIRVSGHEAIQSIYNLTKVLSTDESALTEVKF